MIRVITPSFRSSLSTHLPRKPDWVVFPLHFLIYPFSGDRQPGDWRQKKSHQSFSLQLHSQILNYRPKTRTVARISSVFSRSCRLGDRSMGIIRSGVLRVTISFQTHAGIVPFEPSGLPPCYLPCCGDGIFTNRVVDWNYQEIILTF